MNCTSTIFEVFYNYCNSNLASRITWILAWSVLLAPIASTQSPSCDTWVALPDATMDGSVILAKNSDRPPMEAQTLTHSPRKKHDKETMLKCTYIDIPQVEETYEHIGSKIWWSFGYEHGMNEYGVSIGNEAVWSKEPFQWGDGLLGMDMLRLGLERGKTAYEAMHVIIDLLEKYGQSGDCENKGEWGNANYHNSFILADPKEAWILETAGRYWVNKKITRGVYSISNIYTIENDWDEAHPELVSHALEMGWTSSHEDFNFARDYGNYWEDDSPDPGAMQIRRNQTLMCLQRDYSQITPASMMTINRSHNEETIANPRWGAADTFHATPCMHDSPRSPYRSAASVVAHLRSDMPSLLRQVYWASFSNPCSGVFKPFYMHGPQVPKNYALGSSTYSSESPWWWANRVKLLTDLNYQALNATVRGIFDLTEDWIMKRQLTKEAKALKLLQDNKEEMAVQLLQEFVDENCSRIEKEYRMLNQTLPVMLETVGIKYIYADYLRKWSSEKSVPLPFKDESMLAKED